MPDINERTAVYRFFSAGGELLYVGMSRDPDARELSHARLAADTWYPLAARRTDSWFDSRIASEKAEFEAISSEAPLFNVQDNYYEGPDWQKRFDERKRRMLALMQESTQPLYKLFEALIRHKVQSGVYPEGTKLPIMRVLAEESGISTVTVKHGLDNLAAEGVLRRSFGTGYFVPRSQAPPRSVTVSLNPAEAAPVLREVLSPVDRRRLAELLAED